MIVIRTIPSLCAIVLATSVATAPATFAQVPPAAPSTEPSAAQSHISGMSLAIGAGAIAGVAAFNALALGAGAFPGGAAYAAGAIIPGEMAVAMSRVYAVGSAVLGAWTFEYLQSAGYSTRHSDPTVGIATGAITGAVMFGMLTQALGPVPAAGGTLAPVSTAAVLGSRLIAAATAGTGAVIGGWLYSQWSDVPFDLNRAWAMVGGGIVGVAVGNLIANGEIGRLPYYIGSGAVTAADTVASAAMIAPSRLQAVASGVLGALAVDLWNHSHETPKQ